MKHHLRLPAAALGLAVLLTPSAGFAGFAAMAESTEVVIETEDDVVVDPMEAGDLSLDLGDLSLDLETPTVDPAKKPEPTPTPTPTKEPEKAPPWYTSVNYPKDKINFEKEIWTILTDKWGLQDFQAAGLMSSIQAESSFSPYNAQGIGGPDDRGKYLYDTRDAVGFGLCQWTSSGRKAALMNLAVSRGGEKLVWDFDTQMAFMRQELDMKTLKATKTLYEAAEWTVMRYERPSQRYSNVRQCQRAGGRHAGAGCGQPRHPDGQQQLLLAADPGGRHRRGLAGGQVPVLLLSQVTDRGLCLRLCLRRRQDADPGLRHAAGGRRNLPRHPALRDLQGRARNQNRDHHGGWQIGNEDSRNTERGPTA